MKVEILCGISGSGKSTYARRIIDPSYRLICSADDYFERSGEYRFDPAELSEAHGDCLRRFIETCQKPMFVETLVVDNTNTTIEEIAPYYSIARAYGHEVKLVRFHCEPEVAHSRCKHGNSMVSLEIERRRLARLSIPGFWNLTTEHFYTDRNFR